MKNIIFFTICFLIISCKKEKCPEPIPGNTINAATAGEFGGHIKALINKNHVFSSIDTTCSFFVQIFDSPINNLDYGITSHINSISVNGNSSKINEFHLDYQGDFLRIDVSPYYFKSFFNLINYNINSPKYGTIIYNDITGIPNFTNQNTIPLNFSNSSPYVLTLAGLTNCKYAIASINNDLSSRLLSPSSPTGTFHASDLFDTTVGTKLDLLITLVSEIDTVISGCKIRFEKSATHRYELTCVP